jgi:hypothetical protein
MADPARCPICGHIEPLWIDPPPVGCFDGGTSHCEQAITRAHGEAMRRKVCPDAFDENGKIRPGQIVRVIDAMHSAGLDPMTGRGRGDQ